MTAIFIFTKLIKFNLKSRKVVNNVEESDRFCVHFAFIFNFVKH